MKKRGVLSQLKREKVSYLMLLPNVIMFLIFTVYPILWAMRYMFYDYKGYGEARFVGLENFERVLTRDTVFWNSVVNTFVYVGGKLIITLPIAFLIAVLVHKSSRKNAVVQSVILRPLL